MPDVVDSIVADLVVKNLERYEADFNRATAAHGRFSASVDKMKAQTFDLGAEGQKYKAGVNAMAQAEEQGAARITRTRKKRADDAVAQDEREVASAKKAARAKADVEVAEAARAARLRAAVEKGVANSRITPGSGANLGRTVPKEGAQMAPSTGATVAAAAAAETAAQAGAQKEVNHLLADQATLQARLATAKGKEREAIREQLAEMRLIRQLERAGIADDEIALRLEQRRTAVAAERARVTRSSLLANVNRLTDGTGGGISRTGIAVGIGAAVGVAAIQSAVDYGKALANLSDQLGIAVEDLQAYQKMARDAGVSQEQLTSALGQFNSNLGRAKEGSQEQAKIFNALGVSVKNFASAGDALPTVIDRISQIKDPAHRAAIETQLFGESGRRLDALLSGGAQRVSDLARSLQETGRALSAKEIQELDDTARKLAAVKAELQVDFARVVANNASAIETLASGFARLADLTLKAVDALKIFANSNLSVEDKQKQLALLTPQGRQALLRQNEQQQDQLRARRSGGAPSARVIVNGQDVTNAPETVRARNAAIDAELKRLANEHRDLRLGTTSATPAPTTTPAVQPGRVNTAALGRLGAPAGPKGKSAEQLAKEADQRQRRYEEELARANDDFLQAQRALTGNAEKRYEIDQQSLKAAYQHRLTEIDREVNEKQIDAAKADELKAAEKAAYEANAQVIALQRRVTIENDANALRQQGLQAEVEMLGIQEGLAETAAERRRLAKQRLEAERRAETDSLNSVINSSDPDVSKGERNRARDQLRTQDARFRARSRQDERSNEGPLAQYLRELPRTADQVDEALQRAAANGLQSLNDGLTEAVKKFLHLNGIAGDFLGQLIEIGIQRAVLIPLADKLFPNGGDGSGGLLAGLGKIFGGSRGIASGDGANGLDSVLKSVLGGIKGTRASGGPVVGGNRYLVGENGPEIVEMGSSGRVYPNGALPMLAGPSGGLTVIAPQHFDLTGVVMTEPLLRQFEERNRQYANAVAAQAGRAAVAASPARIKKLQDLGS